MKILSIISLFLILTNCTAHSVRLGTKCTAATTDGSFEKSLMSTSKFKAQMDGIIDISIEKVYKSKEVIEKELTGYKVLHFLLKTFTNSVINWRDDKVSAFDELALECIPKEYLNKDTDLYSSLLDVSCFIASLTDGLALEWYKKLS